SLILVRSIGFKGLAVATSLAAITQGVLSLLLLRQQLGRIGGTHLATTFLKIVGASAVMALTAILSLRQLSVWLPGIGTMAQLLRLTLAIGLGLVAVAVSAKLLRISEFDEMLDQIGPLLAPRSID